MAYAHVKMFLVVYLRFMHFTNVSYTSIKKTKECKLTNLVAPCIADELVEDRSKLCSVFPGKTKHTFKIPEFSL